MSKPFDRLEKYARLILFVQLCLILLFAIIAFVYAGSVGLRSTVAGGIAALASTLISLRRAKVVGQLVKSSPNVTMAALYWGFFQKVVVVTLIVLAGWKIFELDPFYVFACLGIAQLAYIAPLIRA